MFSSFTNAVFRVTLVVIALSSKCTASNTCKGCTDLDELTFEKLVKRFQVTIVKFDIAYPYGDQHEAYSRFAQDVYHIDDLLVATVGIKDYGELDNKNLSQRFNVPEKLPSIKMFLNGDTTKWVDYPENAEVKTEDLKQFVRTNSKVYIGLSGCIREFDDIASEFVKNYSTKMYETALAKANKLIEGYEDEKLKSTGKVYIILMKRVVEVGLHYVEEEKQRTEELLGKKISSAKRQEMLDRLNILKAFEAPDKLAKTEL
ncbi:Protein windbeutel [Pseudolycoriella hygida]|uniref:Protein windbeutel n=1 Tax=Pseudolycoriella hygida TaxID=35572 RepID=A0A9Q0MUJ8_9DIPT|nr:Protein windbeutel [Pseudolycoriella hygida]